MKIKNIVLFRYDGSIADMPDPAEDKAIIIYKLETTCGLFRVINNYKDLENTSIEIGNGFIVVKDSNEKKTKIISDTLEQVLTQYTL